MTAPQMSRKDIYDSINTIPTTWLLPIWDCGRDYVCGTSADYFSGGQMSRIRNGAIGEFAFVLSATQMGLNISQPLIHSHVYDFVVDAGSSFVKVQVKSAKLHKKAYRFSITPGRGLYSAKDVDVFALYAAEEECWYFIPYAAVKNMKMVSITMGREGRFGKFKNRWDLLVAKEGRKK